VGVDGGCVHKVTKLKKGMAIRFQWNDHGVAREDKGTFLYHDPVMGFSTCTFDQTNVQIEVLPWAIRPIVKRKKKV